MDIVTEDLCVGYDSSEIVSFLDGRFFSTGVNIVLGRAGTGKTSLLRTIAGFQQPVGGSVKMGDGSPWKPSGNVGLAFQNPENLFFCSTVRDEVCFALTNRGIREPEADDRGKEWLAAWGLPVEKLWTRNPFMLSGGEKRRVALAACTVFRPRVILLDEPLAGLDSDGQSQLLAVLTELSDLHLIIVATHDPFKMLHLASSVLILGCDDGWRWFDSPGNFLKESLKNHSLFPLPSWYRRAVESIPDDDLPWPTADDVWVRLRDIHGYD